MIEINDAPSFEEEPLLKHEVKVEIDAEGNIVDDTDYIYETSKVTDKEGHEFKIEIEGEKSSDYFEVTEKDSKL